VFPKRIVKNFLVKWGDFNIRIQGGCGGEAALGGVESGGV